MQLGAPIFTTCIGIFKRTCVSPKLACHSYAPTMFCSAITTRKTHPKPVLFIFEQTLHQSTYSSKAASCQAETELVNTFAFPTVTLGVIANSRHLYLWYVLFPNTGAYVRTNTATGSHFSICGPFNNCTGKQWCPRRGRAASISQVLYKT